MGFASWLMVNILISGPVGDSLGVSFSVRHPWIFFV